MKLAPVLLAAVCLLTVAPAAAHASTAAKPWRTCTPQATDRTGIYLVDNDLFTGAPGPSCIKTTDGHNICVLTNYRPDGAGVVGFPDVRAGIFYASRDHGSGFPYQVRKVPNLVVHAGITSCGKGTPPGDWLGEIHMWFWSSDQIRGHGRVELVAVLKDHNWSPYCTNRFRVSTRMMWTGRPVTFRLGHVPARASIGYCGNEHHTGGAGHSWPLIVIQLLHQRTHLGLHLQPLFRELRHLHWLGPDKWLGDVSVGAECASGCEGIAGSLTVSKSP